MRKKIFQINGGRIEIFSFNAEDEKMQDFKTQELLKLPEDERVLHKGSPLSWFSSKNGVVYSCGAYVLKAVPKEGEMQFSRLEERFIQGEFVGDPVRVVERFDDDGQVLYLCPVRDTLDNKIQLTNDLYLLQLLESEDFQNEVLHEESLDGLGELFDISSEPISAISIRELEKMYEAGLVDGDMDSQMDYFEKSGKVLSKLRNK